MSIEKKAGILLVANYPSDVGYAWWLMENYWAEIATHFNKSGINTCLIFPKLNSIPDILNRSPIKLIEHDFDDNSSSGLNRLEHIIKTNSISYVYLTDKPYFSTKYLRLRRFGIKRIVLHDHTPGERCKPNPLIFILKKILFSIPEITCDKYIGVSYFVYNRLVKITGIPARKCTYVLNGIHPIERTSSDNVDLRTDFNLPFNSILIISTGRATLYKGIDFIIECSNKLINYINIDNVYFFHCGDGPDLASLKALVQEYGLDNYFFFLGHRNDVRNLLPSCDIAFHAAIGEAFSLSILEYLSSGLATIVPDNCGNAEAVRNNTTGLLYKPGDINSALGCLQKLILDADLRKRLGEAGHQSVKDTFNIKRANRKLLTELDDVFVYQAN